MAKLAMARQLSGAEWLLLGKVFALFPLVRLGVKLLAFKTLVSRLLGEQSLDGPGRGDDLTRLDRIAYLVQVASRHHFLKPTCLEKALVLSRMLRRRGLEADLRIGTTKKDGRFEAHAWVEHRGQVLLGGPVDGYSPLPVLEAARSQSLLA